MPQGSNEVPDNLQKLIDNVGWIPSDGMDEEEQAIFKLGEEGRCMACHGPLGPSTSVVITTYGIAMAYCSGVCHTDFAVIGWLQEQHEDIVERIKFRGGDSADVAEE